jgi:hypothetical protein
MPSALCLPCRQFVRHHRKPLRWALGLVLLAAFFFWVGAHAPVATLPQMCKVYA